MNNLIHCITGLGTGGSENALLELIKQAHSSSCNHHVISLTKNNSMIRKKLEALGVPVFGPIDGLWFLFKTVALNRKTFVSDRTFFCGWMYHGIIAAFLIRVLVPRAAFVCCVRTGMEYLESNQIIDRLVFRMARKAACSSDRIVFNSFDSKSYHSRRGFYCEKVSVIHNGIRTVSFEMLEKYRVETRKSLGISQSARVICHVGRAHPVKNHELLWSAIAGLAKSDLKCEVVVVGRGVIAPEFLDIKNIRIHLVGEVSDVLPWLAASDVFCQTSQKESFPTALAEALGTGIYGVASDVGDTKFILGGYGSVYNPDDGDCLEEILRKTLESDLVRNMEQVRYIESTFGVEAMNKKLVDSLTLIR